MKYDLHTIIKYCISLFQSYPMTRFGTQNRSFNASYYNQHDWLEYSISKDAVYCFACRNYSSGGSGANAYHIDSFTQNGFKNWKKVRYFL